MMRTLQTAFLVLCCGMLYAPAETTPSNTVPVIRVSAASPTRVDTTTPTDSTFISGKEIERSQAASVPELLSKKANLLFRSSTGNSSSGEVSMRGFGENSGLRVLVEVDGHKLNRPDMGSINWTKIPIANIAYIEVIRGGQNVLYGNHALAGVIKITTKKGGDPKLYLRAVQGDNHFEQYSALATGGEGNWYADAGVDYLRNEGFRDNALSWSKTGHASIGRHFSNGSLTLKASTDETYTQLPGPLTRAEMEKDPTQSSNLGDQEINSTNGLVTLLWEGDHDWGKTIFGAGYSFRDSRWSLSGIYARNQSQGFSLAPRIQFGAEENHIILGWDLFYDKLKHDQLTAPENGDVAAWAELERITTGPYVFAQYEVLKNLTLSGGARYEIARTKNKYVAYDFTNPNPPLIEILPGIFIPNPAYDPNDTVRSVNATNSYRGTITKDGWAAETSLIWNPTDTLSFWIGYDLSYRYPVLDETASYQGYPLSDPLNEKLEPEQGHGFEIGMKYSDAHTTLSLTAFYSILENEIAYDNVQNLNVNIGATERLGAELEAGYAGKYAGIQAQGSIVDARFTEGSNAGKTIPLVPWAHGTVSAWVEPVPQLRLTTHYTYVGSQVEGGDFANEKDKLNDYGLFGARLDIMPTEKVTFFIKADNLLEEEFVSTAYTGGYYPGAGRSVQFGISMEL